MAPERNHPETFTDILNQVGTDKPVDDPDSGEWPTPIHDREWWDSAGNRWHIRGYELDPSKPTAC